jgi:type III pantothenate kinase
MLIAVDIGNSAIKAGFFIDEEPSVLKIPSSPALTFDEYHRLLSAYIKEKKVDSNPEGIIISSVVPGLTPVIRRSMAELFSMKPMMVKCGMRTGIVLQLPRCRSLGSDRIADCAAAVDIAGTPVAAVDCGTATTITVVDEEACLIGGSILPGIGTMNESLAKGTALLSKAPLRLPLSALGTDTKESIRSGLFYGTAGAIGRLLSDMEKESGLMLKVVLTGGFGRPVSCLLQRNHFYCEHLTLQGLKKIYLMNNRKIRE